MLKNMHIEDLNHIKGGVHSTSLSEWILERLYVYLENTHKERRIHSEFYHDDHCHTDRVWSG